MQLVILGGTGLGKATQIAKISNNFNILSISTGEILRTGITIESDLGKQAKFYVERELAPDELMIQFIRKRLLEPNVARDWILEGYPRTV